MENSEVPIEPGSHSNWFTFITSPSQFFRTRKNRVPWFWPLLVASIVSVVIVLLELPYILNSSQLNNALSSIPSNQMSAVQTVTKVSAAIGGIIGPWLAVFIGAFFLWIVTKLFGISIRYMNTVGILSNAYVITLIGTVLTGIVSIATQTMTTGFLSLQEIFHVAGRTGNLLAGVSVFWLWHLYVVTTGVSEVGDASRGRSFAPVFIIAVLGLLFALVSSHQVA